MIDSIAKTKKLKNKLVEINLDSRVYLFGSHAKNQAKTWSDIDVAIVSDGFHDYWKDKRKIEGLVAEIDDNFEIHMFRSDDFENPYDPLVVEVKKYGVLI